MAVWTRTSTSTTTKDSKRWVVGSVLAIISCFSCLVALLVISFLDRVSVCAGALAVGDRRCRVAAHSGLTEKITVGDTKMGSVMPVHAEGTDLLYIVFPMNWPGR